MKKLLILLLSIIMLCSFVGISAHAIESTEKDGETWVKSKPQIPNTGISLIDPVIHIINTLYWKYCDAIDYLGWVINSTFMKALAALDRCLLRLIDRGMRGTSSYFYASYGFWNRPSFPPRPPTPGGRFH